MTDIVSHLAAGPLFGLPLSDLWFGLVFAIFAAFLFLDGFDFGVGLLFATRRDHHERETLLAAIGPFWDGNEVWLVVFGGALFAVFPGVYATLFSRHYLLMFAILAALIVRGLAPEMYEQREDDGWQTLWGRAFVAGSVAAPFFLGLFVANWLTGATRTVTVSGVLVGLAVVALTVVDGAAFLGLKTRGDLRLEMGWHGVAAEVAYLVLAVASLVGLAGASADLSRSLLHPIPLALVAVTVGLGGAYVWATGAGRHYLAFGAAAGQVFTLVALVATLMYPTVDRATGLVVGDAVVSTLSLNLTTIMASLLLPLVVTYFVVLYSSFSGPVEAGEAY